MGSTPMTRLPWEEEWSDVDLANLRVLRPDNCVSLSPDRLKVCLLLKNHKGPCGWDQAIDPNDEPDRPS